jgi:hypothetical protein
MEKVQRATPAARRKMPMGPMGWMRIQLDDEMRIRLDEEMRIRLDEEMRICLDEEMRICL